MLYEPGQFYFHYTRKQGLSYRELIYCIFILHKNGRHVVLLSGYTVYSLYPCSSYVPVRKYFTTFSKSVNWQSACVHKASPTI